MSATELVGEAGGYKFERLSEGGIVRQVFIYCDGDSNGISFDAGNGDAARAARLILQALESPPESGLEAEIEAEIRARTREPGFMPDAWRRLRLAGMPEELVPWILCHSAPAREVR